VAAAEGVGCGFVLALLSVRTVVSLEVRIAVAMLWSLRLM